jgi:hypothetical protein
MKRLFPFLRVLTCCVVMSGAICVQADDVRLSDVRRRANGEVEVTISGAANAPVVLQSSSDLKSWEDLQAVTLSGGTATYIDTHAMGVRERSYRVRSGEANEPATLPDLGSMENRVFPAPEGFNTVQFARNGSLGFFVWRDRDLLFRERAANGSWSEEVIASNGNTFKPYLTFDFQAPREDYRFQPSTVLLYDSVSVPHIFKCAGKNILHYARNGSWTIVETIMDAVSNADIAVLEASIAPDNTLHLAALSAGSPRNLTYGTNRNGRWNWTTISTVTDPPLTYWAPPFAARWLAMDVDSHNAAHIAFRSSLDLTYDVAGHPRAYSELKYASNASGRWVTKVVSKPQDLSGEAANGASIAMGPDDKPRILSWYDERADTGSAQDSRLYFHQQDASGNWTASVVVSRADGYIAGDGNKGAGFSPYLRFDPKGVAHIVYLDHAGEHFSNIGQQEYAGNVRHAWWNGSGWSFETVFAQGAPLKQEAVYPAFAVSENEIALAVLERDTQWNYGSFPPLSPSKYYFRFFTKSLP